MHVPTSPQATGQTKVNVSAPASVDYLNYLAQRRNAVVSQVEKAIAAQVSLTYTYDVAFNGFSLTQTGSGGFPSPRSRMAWILHCRHSCSNTMPSP